MVVDNRLNKKYTLEEHLKFLSLEDKDYEILYSIWDLNKKNLIQGLNLISSSFPHYSVHDVNHSMTIINNIQCFLGEERIKHLSATDTFLILMAALTHDIGMILMYDIVESEWENDNFKILLEEFASSRDSVIAKSANLLMRIHKHAVKEDLKDFRWALQVKNAVIILTAEIFRTRHAKQSANYLRSNETFKQLANNFHAEQLPSRFMDLLANIAFLHGEDFETVMVKLYQEANGYKGDYIHPRFVAYMIRLGDLLDFDNTRFNVYSKTILKEVPETSKLHEQKHASVKHMLISPNAIEAVLDCPTEEVYRISRSWFDWLEKEVSNQSREWTNITPEDLGGLPPVISKDSIKILFNGIQSNPDLLNLKFSMSQEKMFSILQGGGIYKEPGFAFIREIVQNAFDASKMQIWNDIKIGFYDSYFEDSGKSKDNIEFPDDIASTIYKQYPVILRVKWKDEKNEILQFECIDCGTGISEATLLRMTNCVGESRKKDLGYPEEYKKMPYFLQPTAAFGIGLQSVFFVASKFEMETSFLGETSKRIVFRSAADNQYCSIVEENVERKRGTTVKVDISKERFEELFGTSFGWDILDSTDIFKKEGDNLYLAKIDGFVRQTFIHVKNINFIYESASSERGFKNCVNNEVDTFKTYKDYRYYFSYQDTFLVFTIFEKKYGSTFQLWFNNEIVNAYRPCRRLLLRDVLVANAKFNYYKTAYLGFEWNLCSQSTDKVVDLSRDNLTYNGRIWITNALLNELLPALLTLINNDFIDELKSGTNKDSLIIQYFNYSLTLFGCGLNCYDVHFLRGFKLPIWMASCNKLEITADQILTKEILILVAGFDTDGRAVIKQNERENIESKYSNELNDELVLWGDHYLHDALIFNFKCIEVIKYEKGCHIYKLKKRGNIKEMTTVKSPKEYLLSLDGMGPHKCSRKAIYGLEEYTSLAVKLNYISGFEDFPDYSTCCIYSPFSEKRQVEKLVNEVGDKDAIQGYIRKNIADYIPSYMMEIIKKYNINNDVSEEQIIEGYISLINDFIEVKKRSLRE